MRRFRFNLAWVAFTHDLIMAALSFVLSQWLRLGDELLAFWDGIQPLAAAAILFAVISGAVFLWFRMYRGRWRYASVPDLLTITRAATLAILIFLPIEFLISRLSIVPRSTLLINWFTLIALLGGPRFIYRLIKDRRLDLTNDGRRIPVLLAGAGDAAELFIRASQRGTSLYRPVGMLSDDADAVGRHIHGVPVIATLARMDEAVEALKRKGRAPQRLVLTDSGLKGTRLRALLDAADRMGMALARLPAPTELRSGQGDGADIAPIAVTDLLGRPQTVLDRAAMRHLIAGRRVLITGAGGSIGSELVRQAAECEPASICLVENSEFALYTIGQEISERFPDLPRRMVIADVRERGRIAQVFGEFAPELVFHAAALKHVPVVEDNPMEGLLTNAIGTRIVAEACVAHRVGLMVLISTDKAVNPSSVMGAAKRAAETYCQALDMAASGPGKAAAPTRFVTVRFGNVLGSTGSVVPLFQRQLAAGGPITVTDPEVTRYFMTVREAVELVLQAASLGMDNQSYRGRIFVLDMGDPIKIVDLARQMIRLAGLKPEIDVKIVFTGLRPGEKLAEEIFHSAEPPARTEREGVLVAVVRAQDREKVSEALERMELACREHNLSHAMAALRTLVPEYHPTR
jgi:O-antigen biosynthesis protein WbqV